MEMTFDIKEIDWGTGEAKAEIKQLKNEFGDIFVNIDNIELIKEKHHLFIWGRRGSGKTAMAWKLSNSQHRNKNMNVIKIDFEDAEDWVGAVLARIGNFRQLEGFPLLKSCADLWYNSILTEIMRKLVANENIDLVGKKKVTKYINKYDGECGVFKILLGKIEELGKLLEYGDPINSLPYSLTVNGIEMLDKHLRGSTEFIDAIEILNENLKKYPELKIRIVVDSVDKWMITPAFIEKASDDFFVLSLVVRGLTRALIKIHTHEYFKNSVEIKAFLPIDMKPYMEDRASEHEDIYHHYIQWSDKELAAFIAKRVARNKHLITGSGAYAETLNNTWDELFPFLIKNSETDVKHKPFDYLLRHSQFRPREILICCRAISEYAKTENKSSLTQEEFRDVVHQHCNNEVSKTINEFKPSLQNIHEILNRFTGRSNILKSEQVYSILKNVDFTGSIKDTNELIQFLYDMGFLGIIMDQHEKNAFGKPLPFTISKEKTLYFNFKFLDPMRSIFGTKEFVIHPIFYGRFSIKADNKITICQHITP